MKEPGSEGNSENASKPSSKNRLSTRLKAVACLAFLVLSIVLWIVSGRSWLLWLLLLIPCFLCEEWLAEKVNTERSGWSTAEAGFSVWRILYGVILVLLFFGVVYGLTLIARWVF